MVTGYGLVEEGISVLVPVGSRIFSFHLVHEVTGFLNVPNPSNRTMALRLTQPHNRNEYQKSSWA
jgi:hypothetical protein